MFFGCKFIMSEKTISKTQRCTREELPGYPRRFWEFYSKSVVTSSPDDRTTCTVSAVRAEPERKASLVKSQCGFGVYLNHKLGWKIINSTKLQIEMINNIPFWNPFGEYDCFMIVFWWVRLKTFWTIHLWSHRFQVMPTPACMTPSNSPLLKKNATSGSDHKNSGFHDF